MKIIKNPNKKQAAIVAQAVKDNDGYCPCKLEHTQDNKCMCLEFKQQDHGMCHCGLYIKLNN